MPPASGIGSPTPQAPRPSLDPETGDTWRLAAVECGENHRFALAEEFANLLSLPSGWIGFHRRDSGGMMLMQRCGGALEPRMAGRRAGQPAEAVDDIACGGGEEGFEELARRW